MGNGRTAPSSKGDTRAFTTVRLTTVSYAARTCGRGRRPRDECTAARGCRHERPVRLSGYPTQNVAVHARAGRLPDSAYRRRREPVRAGRCSGQVANSAVPRRRESIWRSCRAAERRRTSHSDRWPVERDGGRSAQLRTRPTELDLRSRGGTAVEPGGPGVGDSQRAEATVGGVGTRRGSWLKVTAATTPCRRPGEVGRRGWRTDQDDSALNSPGLRPPTPSVAASQAPINLTTVSYAARTCGRGRRPR